jgi:hypothetical protein
LKVSIKRGILSINIKTRSPISFAAHDPSCTFSDWQNIATIATSAASLVMAACNLFYTQRLDKYKDVSPGIDFTKLHFGRKLSGASFIPKIRTNFHQKQHMYMQLSQYNLLKGIFTVA